MNKSDNVANQVYLNEKGVSDVKVINRGVSAWI